jgi:hypothetical protein
MADVFIFDEILAESLDIPHDRRAVDSALNRPDPFANMWDKLRESTPGLPSGF